MDRDSLRLVVANIEKDAHLENFIAFGLEVDPEVMLLQEVPLRSFPYLLNSLGAQGSFVPMGYMPTHEGGPLEVIGLGALVRERETPIRVGVYKEFCYRRMSREAGNDLPLFKKEENYSSDSYVQHLEVVKSGHRFGFANTHFPWTPDGCPDREQYRCMPQVVEYAKINRLIVCGDLNAPRVLHNGEKGPIWDMLAKEFRDNIPEGVTSTLDPKLHRTSKNGVPLPLVVDALFTPEEYRAEKVILHSSVSDHKAISAVIRSVV